MTKHIIVTGAGRGIGRAITASLIQDNFKIIAVDINSDFLASLKQEFQDQVDTFQLQVGDHQAVQSLFATIPANSLFGLVNNAGVYLGKGLSDYTAEEIAKVLNINLQGAIHFSKFFQEALFALKHEGVIINISSSSIHGGSDPVYSSSKAGLIGLTKACATRFSPFIRVNAITPGIVETDIFTTIPKDVIDQYRAKELVKKPLSAQDVANTVGFLMSDKAHNYSGAVFELNNGFHL